MASPWRPIWPFVVNYILLFITTVLAYVLIDNPRRLNNTDGRDWLIPMFTFSFISLIVLVCSIVIYNQRINASVSSNINFRYCEFVGGVLFNIAAIIIPLIIGTLITQDALTPNPSDENLRAIQDKYVSIIGTTTSGATLLIFYGILALYGFSKRL